MKIRNQAILLSIFFGIFGIHRFYLNQRKLGILYFLFSWTLIPAFIGIIDAIIWAFWTQNQWDKKFNNTKSSIDHINYKYTKKGKNILANQSKIQSQTTTKEDFDTDIELNDREQIELIILKAIKNKKPLTLNISLPPSEYDELANKFSTQKLYLSLPLKIKIQEAPTYAAYLPTMDNLKHNYQIVDEVKNGKTIHTIETTVIDCEYYKPLPQILSKLSRKISVIYRGKEYPQFSEFKVAIYNYKEGKISKIEDYFIDKQDQITTISLIPSKIDKASILNTGNDEYSDTFEKSNEPVTRELIVEDKVPSNKTIFDFVAIDFETSNRQHSICSVGVVGVKDSVIIEERHWFIRPKSALFEHWNVARHGITYEKVKNSPTFLEVWEELQHFVVGQKLVAHNAASTDITCLRKAFEEFSITPTPKLDNYDCTLKLSRIYLPQLENHQLPTVVAHFDLEAFHHHDALEDAHICSKVYLKLLEIIPNSNILKKAKEKNTIYYKSLLPKADLENILFIEQDDSELLYFEGKNIVVTGTFESFIEREVLLVKLIEKGAIIKNTVNSKTNIIIVGNNPGPSKIENAKRFINEGIQIEFLDEKQLLTTLR